MTFSKSPSAECELAMLSAVQQQPAKKAACPTEFEMKDLRGLAKSEELNR